MAMNNFANAPGRSDFTLLSELQTGPAGERQYTRPIVLLVGNNTASAAEDFVLALRQRPHVTVVGSPTAGALGRPQARPTAQWMDVSTHGVKGLYRGYDKL